MSGSAHTVTPCAGQFTYPTRNFATLGTSVTSANGRLPSARSGHFCLTPHVAMRIGLYLHENEAGVACVAPGVQSLRIPSRISSHGAAPLLARTFIVVGKTDELARIPAAVRCSRRRIAPTIAANRSKSAGFTTSGWRSKNGTTRPSSSRNRVDGDRSTPRWSCPLARTVPQPKKWINASSTARCRVVLVHVEDGMKLPSASGPSVRVAVDRRRRSNPLRRRSRPPNAHRARATSLRFPADCPHRTDFHCACQHPNTRV